MADEGPTRRKVSLIIPPSALQAAQERGFRVVGPEMPDVYGPQAGIQGNAREPPRIPGYIQQHMAMIEAQAREMYEKPVEVRGNRPALAHRNQGVEEKLPREVLERMDRIVTTDFRGLRRGLDYDRTGSIGVKELDEMGLFRNVAFNLTEPVTLEGHTIYGVRLKGVTFNTDELHREFDLLEVHRMGGMHVPAGAIRLDRYIDREGIVVATPHVNEPIGAEFLDETIGEARGHKLCLQRGERVDYPLCWYEFANGLTPPNGMRLGVMAVGLTCRKRVRLGEVIGNLAEEQDKAAGEGKRVREGWREDVESVFLAYVNRVRGLHGEGRGLYHESPHPGQFHFEEGGRDRILVSDLRNIEPLDEMTYPQRIGCVALDLRSVLIYALRYDSFPMFSKEGLDFLGLALRYFRRTGKSTLQELREIAPRSGGRVFEDVFNLSHENRRPITFYKGNPLIKAVMEEYPNA